MWTPSLPFYPKIIPNPLLVTFSLKPYDTSSHSVPCSQLLCPCKTDRKRKFNIFSSSTFPLRFKSWLKRGRMTRRESRSIINLAYIINIQFKPSQAPLTAAAIKKPPSSVCSGLGLKPKYRGHCCHYHHELTGSLKKKLETPSISLLFGKYQPFHFTSPPVHFRLDVPLILTTPARNTS